MVRFPPSRAGRAHCERRLRGDTRRFATPGASAAQRRYQPFAGGAGHWRYDRSCCSPPRHWPSVIPRRRRFNLFLPHLAGRNEAGCCLIQHRDHNAKRRTVMIIKSATRLAFAAGSLTAIATLPAAHAQMGGTAPGSYWTSPGPMVMAPRQVPTAMALQVRMVPRQAPTARSAGMFRRPPQTRANPMRPTARRPTQVTFHHPGRRNAMSRRANTTTRW